MGVTKKFIVIEDKLQEIVDILEPVTKTINNEDVEFKVHFDTGLEYDLIERLSVSNDYPYPLVFLESGFRENHLRTHVQVDNMTLVIAMKSNKNTSVKNRLEENFKPIILDVANKLRDAFNRANTIYTDDTYAISKFYRYGDGKENKFPAIWDAIKITFSCKINDKCFNLKVDEQGN